MDRWLRITFDRGGDRLAGIDRKLWPRDAEWMLAARSVVPRRFIIRRALFSVRIHPRYPNGME
jgi:hypothetical protein